MSWKKISFGSWNRFPTETVDDSSDDIMALRFFLPSLQKFYFKHSQYKILGYHSLATENMISQIFICDCHSYSCKARFLSPYFLPQWFFFPLCISEFLVIWKCVCTTQDASSSWHLHLFFTTLLNIQIKYINFINFHAHSEIYCSTVILFNNALNFEWIFSWKHFLVFKKLKLTWGDISELDQMRCKNNHLHTHLSMKNITTMFYRYTCFLVT